MKKLDIFIEKNAKAVTKYGDLNVFVACTRKSSILCF